jgi:hypothetical protein
MYMDACTAGVREGEMITCYDEEGFETPPDQTGPCQSTQSPAQCLGQEGVDGSWQQVKEIQSENANVRYDLLMKDVRLAMRAVHSDGGPDHSPSHGSPASAAC